MIKKEETIRAFEELSFKYRHPWEEEFFNEDSCPLCKIHINKDNKDEKGCRGCPLADTDGHGGCALTESYKEARISLITINISEYNKRFPSKMVYLNVPDSFIARALFFEKYLEVIKKINAERFTIKGWTFFEEIERIIY